MNNSNIQNLKSEQRLLLKQQIAALSTEEREVRSRQLNQNLKQYLKNHSGRWGAFKSLALEPLINWSELNQNICWYFVETHQQDLKFVHKNEALKTQDLDGLCIPALGFHLNGARLGRGGGFYDRALAQYNKIKIGIAYDFNVSANIPFETHDIKVDVIITDHRIVDAA